MEWDWKAILFSFKGRLNRGKYWLVELLTFVAWLVLFMFWALFGGILGETADLTLAVLSGAPLAVASLWAALATGIKRLHDREKSGWWMLMFYLVPGLLSAIGDTGSGAGLFFGLIGFVISMWGFVELGCLKGTTGPNTYGPDPLADAPNMTTMPPAL